MNNYKNRELEEQNGKEMKHDYLLFLWFLKKNTIQQNDWILKGMQGIKTLKKKIHWIVQKVSDGFSC